MSCHNMRSVFYSELVIDGAKIIVKYAFSFHPFSIDSDTHHCTK